MPTIRFKAKLSRVDSWAILRLPESASAKLRSRGMAMVAGTINGSRFQILLEPDGRGSHWFMVDETLLESTGANVGDIVTLAIEPVKEWPEPEVPEDLQKALTADPQVYTLWLEITPMARWDWLRWIRSAKKEETRRRRIETACSKLRVGERRPCCFNRNMCTEPSVSKNGVLIESISDADGK